MNVFGYLVCRSVMGGVTTKIYAEHKLLSYAKLYVGPLFASERLN